MSRKCQLTGKKPMSSNSVSHANNKARRKQLPNLQSKRIYVAELKRYVRLRISTAALRTIDKIGLGPFLKKQGLTLKDIA